MQLSGIQTAELRADREEHQGGIAFGEDRKLANLLFENCGERRRWRSHTAGVGEACGASLHIFRRLLRSAGRLHRRALLFREGKGAFRSSKTIHDDNPDEGSVKPATKVMTAGRAKKIAANSPNPPNTLKAERKNHGESGAHDEAEDRTIRNNAVRVR